MGLNHNCNYNHHHLILVAATYSILNLPLTGPEALSMVSPTAHLETAFLDFTSAFIVDDRAYLFSKALLTTLKLSFTWLTEDRLFAQYTCEEFLDAIPLPTTPPSPPLPPYKLSVDISDQEVDFLIEVLLGFLQTQRLQFLLYYLWQFYLDIPEHPLQDGLAVINISTSLLPTVHSSTWVLQHINPTPLPTPSALSIQVFRPLTLADTPLTLVDNPILAMLTPLSYPQPIPPDLDPQPLAPAAMPPPSPQPSSSQPTLADPSANTPPHHLKVHTCWRILGQRHCPPSSTWTSPHFKPPLSTLLLHCSL